MLGARTDFSMGTTRSQVLYALLLALTSPVTALVLQNITIALPSGSSDHGTPGLLCTPTKAIDLLVFYLLNYVAHAATVLTRPGERADDYFVSVLGSLLFPTLGVYRGIDAILSGAVWVRNDDLRKAACSGALCVVVRGLDWRPRDGDGISNVIFKRGARAGSNEVDNAHDMEMTSIDKDQEKASMMHIIPFSPPYMFTRFGRPVFVHRRIIHGTYILPAGYRFAILPRDVQFTSSAVSPYSSPPEPSKQPTIEVSATYNIVKALIALAQSAYALSTLYRSRGDQIKQFGYAAFGLTVAPYAVMSIMNLIGNLCRPEYPSLYMVESSIMDEARQQGGVFEGAVARAREDDATSACTSAFADGEDLDTVHFHADDAGTLDANFRTTFTPSHRTLTVEGQQDVNKGDAEPTISTKEIKLISPASTTSSIYQSHSTTISPIPQKLNYIGTTTSPLLLIPSHPPLLRRRTPPLSPSIIETPAQHSMSSLTLCRTYPFGKHYTWTPAFTPSLPSRTAQRWRWSKYTLTTLIALLPVLITGVLSGFREGAIPSQESSTWRTFTAQWLSFGVFTGLWWVLDQEGKDAMANGSMQVGPLVRAVTYVVTASPAVGGYIVVGQMLFRYGVCMWVGD
ncbi:hypothetical protein BKA66DRAFT_497851 [Pyrenochaeta sp. MPI-SDFR-AT-0127]|nr:hypothetical protein BKA66DRAFT_497851 [Pyrenochaeta sp. MPI-SDFR-AT-0127]